MQSTMYKCSGRTLTPKQAEVAPNLLQYIAGVPAPNFKRALIRDVSDPDTGTTKLEIELSDGTIFLVS